MSSNTPEYQKAANDRATKLRQDVRARTVGGKFNSIGSAEQQEDNVALVTRLCGQIGVDGYLLVKPEDRPFIDDTRYKLNAAGYKAFGWRQVEKMVTIHKYVEEVRKCQAAGAKR